MSNPNFAQIAATTANRRSTEFQDAVTENNALLAYMNKNGRFTETSTGGNKFLEPIVYGEVSNAKFYDGGQESFTVGVENVVTASEWERKFQAGFMYFTEAERVANRGKEAALRLIEGKITSLKATLANAFSTAIYDGSTSSEIVGLQTLVADDPTSGTVGGIDASTNAYWRNKAATGVAIDASNVISLLDGVWLEHLRGVNRADLLVAGNAAFSAYQQALQADQRFTSWEKSDVLNFDGLRYQSAMMLFDPHCDDQRIYGLDSKSFRLYCDAGCKWTTEEARQIQTAMYDVTPIKWSGALVVADRARQFVVSGVGA